MLRPDSFFDVIFDNFFSKFFHYFNLTKVLKTPVVMFIWGILSKWYFAILVAALIVTFWVLKGLSSTGIIAISERVVFKAFNETKSIAKNCVPLILHPQTFWQCLQNPPVYSPDRYERSLIKKLTPDDDSDKNAKNPYE